MAEEMVPLNLSLPIDRRLWHQDVRGSKAWARALAGAGVLTEDEKSAIVAGLSRVARRIESRGLAEAPDEDIHSAVERMLGEEIGPLAGKLHTGRSRNDQSATGVRLFGMEAASTLVGLVAELVRALVELATRGMGIVMPGYTHLQQAQPVSAAYWALSHTFPLLRDAERLRAARRAAAVLPLGAGALAGCPFPVNREAIRAELGFVRVSENSMDAVSDRDWICDLLYAGATIGVHISRLAEDLVIFSSREFGFLRLSDGFSTGSSLMPQKRNPDAAELARGKSARLITTLSGVLVLLKGLPTSYNRDLHEDKEAIFDTVDTLGVLLPAMRGTVAALELRPSSMKRALDPSLLATDLADYLVRRGIPFRQTHEIVGRLVRRAEAAGVALSELPARALKEVHPALPSDLGSLFNYTASLESRDTPGGSSSRSILEQMEIARRSVDELETFGRSVRQDNFHPEIPTRTP